MTGKYLDLRENILLVGPSGTGKTHHTTTLGMAACPQGRKVRFFRVTELVTLLQEVKEERHLLRMRQQLAKFDLLVLDERGYVPASKAGAELLFDVITTAYDRNSLIGTTNLPFENWTEGLGSERLTGAAMARLTHRCRILETKGESYRLQDAKRRRRRTDRPRNRTNCDTPTTSGEIDTTKQHHFRLPRAVFNRGQHVHQRASERAFRQSNHGTTLTRMIPW